MNRLPAILIFAAVLFSTQVGFARPKVAVVLSGGGAKGVAHIGALKVVEQAGIPIDIIVGTSMGAIVGSLYSIGYTSLQLDSLVTAQNWEFLLSDRIPRRNQPFPQKEADDKYQITLPFDKKLEGTSGLIKGVNLSMEFDRLMVDYRDSMDFASLPIPFACVASDISRGGAVVYREGRLPTAVRASMAIPGVFTPVYIDSMVLVDGGIFNNFPTDVARAMGADVIIGVDVQNDLRTHEQLDGAGAGMILEQIVGLAMSDCSANVALADVYIKVDVKGYSAANFKLPALDTLMRRGERQAREQWDELLALKSQIGVAEDFTPPVREPYVAHNSYVPDYRRRKNLENTLSAGVEFDTEEIASLIINATFRFGKRTPMEASLTARLGKRLSLGADYMLMTSPQSSFRFGYSFNRDNIVINHNGDRAFNPVYNRHATSFSYVNMDFVRQNLRLEAGFVVENYNFNQMLSSRLVPELAVKEEETMINYFAHIDFETLDSRLFPMRGTSASAWAELYTDNFYQYDHRAPLPSVAASWMTAFPVTRSFSIIPSIYGRVLPDIDIPFGKLNAVGGKFFGRYLSGQMPFSGIGFMEVAPHTFLSARLQLRGRIGVRHFVWGTFNYALTGNDFMRLFETGQNWFGASVNYGYNFRVIPIMVSFNWSNVTHRLGFYVQAGYTF